MLPRSRVVAALAVWLLLPGAAAIAHPLGNFTINHLTKLSFSARAVRLRYVLDMAEIPTYQTMREITPDGKMNAAQLASWARTEAAALLPDLRLSAAGAPVALALDDSAARTRPGAGGLPLLYLTLDANGALPPVTAGFTFRDDTFAGRLGWHDVVVAPQSEPTHELTSYPNALLGSPRSLLAVDVSLASDGRAAVRPVVTDADTFGGGVPVSAVRSNQLSDMLARGTSDAGFVVLTFIVAIGLGALHALEPGHGKTLLAISLVGARATVRQAAILAGSLTFAHTIGVLALGVAINLFKGYFVPESIYPWITLLSGLVIAFIGARAIKRQIDARRPFAHTHAHGHTHAHAHDHVHAHGEHDHDDLDHARLHALPGDAPLTFQGTVWAAMSGGVAPCPAALVVLLAAIALDQVTYGILVIVAFSFGLAATLTGLGIAVVRGAVWLQRRREFDRVVRYGPLVSALVIATIGAVMVGQGFAAQGAEPPALAVSALVALAIAGYAFSHPSGHAHVQAESA